jgi:hypothetical protein
MSVYSTEELIKILADERRACMNGERLNLAASASGNPLLDRFLKADGIQKFSAYRDFKAAVHRYQRQHQVSGIIWRELKIKDVSLRYPAIDEELAALKSDLVILKAHQDSILAFWWNVTTEMDFYLSINNRKDYRQIHPDQVNAIALQGTRRTQRRCESVGELLASAQIACTEWANLSVHGNANFLEIILQLGWGQPEEASYKRGWPGSGSEFIHAVNSGQYPIY